MNRPAQDIVKPRRPASPIPGKSAPQPFRFTDWASI